MKPGDRAAKIAEKNALAIFLELQYQVQDFAKFDPDSITPEKLESRAKMIEEAAQQLREIARIQRAVNTQLGVK